jgi:hypothetical protein
MDHHRFTYLANPGADSFYFVINDTVQLEYSGKSLRYESIIKWRSCYSYILTVRKVYFEDSVFRPDDTLAVNVTSMDKDTLICNASSHNVTFPIRLLRNE